jgi:CheY-like chemotaxis protein
MLLAQHKIDCELAHNGQEAVDVMRDHGDIFEVIFMDHTMPVKVSTSHSYFCFIVATTT